MIFKEKHSNSLPEEPLLVEGIKYLIEPKYLIESCFSDVNHLSFEENRSREGTYIKTLRCFLPTGSIGQVSNMFDLGNEVLSFSTTYFKFTPLTES